MTQFYDKYLKYEVVNPYIHYLKLENALYGITIGGYYTIGIIPDEARLYHKNSWSFDISQEDVENCIRMIYFLFTIDKEYDISLFKE